MWYLHRIQWMHHLNPQRWKWQSSWLPGLWNYLFYFHLGGFFNLQTLFILMVEFNFFWEETLLVIIFFVVGCWNTQEIKFVFTHSHVELSSWKSTSQCAHSCVRDKIQSSKIWLLLLLSLFLVLGQNQTTNYL